MNQAIQLDPSNANAYFNRALVNISKNSNSEEIKDFQSAVSLDPSLKADANTILKNHNINVVIG